MNIWTAVRRRLAPAHPAAIASTERPPASGRSVVLLSAALGLVLAVCAIVLIYNLRERALDTAGDGLDRLAMVLAQQADRSLQSVELLQDSLVERFKATLTDKEFRDEINSAAFHRELASRIEGLPQLHTLAVIDPQGTMMNHNHAWPIETISVAHRDFYQVLSSEPDRVSYIGAPMMSRASGFWTVIIARRIVGADGNLLGLLSAALDLEDFERLYQATELGERSSIKLFRQDGTLLASAPPAPRESTLVPPAGAEFKRMVDAGLTHDLLRYRPDPDAADRMQAIRLLQNYPLAITIETTVTDALRDWRQQIEYLIFAAFLLEIIIICVGLLMARQLRGQRLLAEATAARGQAEAALMLARERERTQDQARIQHARLAAAIEHMPQGLAMFDADDRLVIANARHGDALGLSNADQVVGLHFRDLVERALARGIINREGATRMMAAIKAGIAAGRSGSNVIRLLDGRSLSASFSPITSGGWLVTIEDVTERLSAEAQIAYMAHHDALTGLPNRILLRERLGAALALSRRGQSFAVLCLDLDRFKAVNDSLGHAIGDALLCAVAGRMLALMRESDTAARLGGDEFAIIQTGLRQRGDAALLADRLIEALSAPYDLDGHTVSIGTSIGIALLPGGGDDIETVLRNADQALYRAKFGGRGHHQFHQPELDAGASLVPEIEPAPQDPVPG